MDAGLALNPVVGADAVPMLVARIKYARYWLSRPRIDRPDAVDYAAMERMLFVNEAALEAVAPVFH